MKLRITKKDLEDLSVEQKQNLCDLWIPHVYDAAVATVCVDAAEEKFDQITYVVGGIKLLKHHDMLLSDLKFLPDQQFNIQEEEANSNNIVSGGIDQEEPAEEEFSFDEDFNFEFQRPEAYLKQDCIPLLDIGQLIDILERKNFGQASFYLSAAIGDYYFEMGKEDISSSSYDENEKECELCDILWEAVKSLL